jgi:4a-hydroxytetrahydrobiopterin dehydratase
MSDFHKPIAPDALVKRALSATEVVANLAQLSGWQLFGDGADVAIEKTFTFSNYFETLAFVNAVAFAAHRQDHHPELLVTYRECRVRLNSHDINGLSGRDFHAAAQVDALLG